MILLVLIIQIILINLVSGAENITFTPPSSVNYGESFDVNLELINFIPGIYDIKIDITNSGGDRIGEIYDGENWITSYQFVDEAIDTSESNSSSLSLNITESYEGVANLTVKIRENGNPSSSQEYGVYQTSVSIPEDQGPEPEEVRVEVSWDDEDIENGKDFDITINVFNLEDKSYDFKIWIEGEEGDEYEDTVISDRYGEDSDGDDEWKSGTYWIYNLFVGPGDKRKKVELRIRDDYENFHGDARLFFKLEFGSEEDNYIEILRKEKSQISDSQSSSQSSSDSMREAVIQSMQNTTPSIEVISLGRKAEDLKEQSNILYQSKNELIKKFAIYGFALFCVILVGLLAFEKLK
tara:strand:- start:2387 stop:3442 length:1056 start_codon:yes stop_codon:yes gene_type:complete